MSAPETIFGEVIIPVVQGIILGVAFIALVSMLSMSFAVGACERDSNGTPCTITTTVKPIPD